VLDNWENATWTARVRMFANPSRANPSIKLILLDQPSLDWGSDQMGWSWPWPRQIYAPIIDFLKNGGARSIVFDVLYTEPSVYDAQDDRILGQSIADSGCFVGALFLGRHGNATNFPPGLNPRRVTVPGLEVGKGAGFDRLLRYPTATFPIPDITTNAAWLADVASVPDPDGIIREVKLFGFFGDRAIPTLGLAAYLQDLRSAGTRTTCSLHGEYFITPSGTVRLDSRGRALIRYHGAMPYTAYSAAAVFQSAMRLDAGEKPSIDPETFADAVVLFGFSAPGLKDLRPTPLNRVAPGVLIHAAVLDNLLSNAFIARPAGWIVSMGVIMLGILAAFAGIFSRNARQTVFALVGGLLLAVVPAFAGYAAGYWWPLVAPAFAAMLALVSAIVVKYATEGRQKAYIKRAFKHYLSPAVIERIIENPSSLELGGERRELTIFFSDLQGFSTFSEKLDPRELTTLLNDFLTDMTDIILDEGGTLDKYEGDAILAFWNAPLDQQDHAERAVRTAIRCQTKLAERRPAYRERTGAALFMRVGLHTGPVVVGNMGSSKRFDYTVLGDAANLASRLEGANKAFGTYTMISEITWNLVSARFTGREIGCIRVVGRATPIRVYEPFLEDTPPEWLDLYEEGLLLCGQKDWSRALYAFGQCGDDPVAARYAKRCQELVETGETWDGIWNLMQK